MSIPPIKVSEQSPIQPLYCAATVVVEEVCAGVKSLQELAFPPADTIEKTEDGCPFPIKLINFAVGTVTFLYDVVNDTVNYLIRWVMNGLACLTGEKPDFGNVSPAALAASRNYVLNRSRMADIAHDDAIPAEDLKRVYNMKLDSILGVYDKLPHALKKAEIRNSLDTLVTYVRNGVREVEQRNEKRTQALLHNQEPEKAHKNDFEYTEMERMLMHIAFNLSQAHVSDDKRCNALQKIVDAMNGCGPHKYKGVKRSFEIVIGGTLDQKILLWGKDFKRELILQRYETGQMHTENDAIDKVRDWGLGGDQAELNDVYQDIGGCGRASTNYRYTLNLECTPARFLEAIKTNTDDEDPQFFNNYFEARQQRVAKLVKAQHAGIDENGEQFAELCAAHPEAAPADLYDAAGGYWDKVQHLDANGQVKGIDNMPSHKLVAWLLEQHGFFVPSLVTL